MGLNTPKSAHNAPFKENADFSKKKIHFYISCKFSWSKKGEWTEFSEPMCIPQLAHFRNADQLLSSLLLGW